MAGEQEMVAHHLQGHYTWDHVYEGALDDAYWKNYFFQIHQIYAFQLLPETEEAVVVLARSLGPEPQSPPGTLPPVEAQAAEPASSQQHHSQPSAWYP